MGEKIPPFDKQQPQLEKKLSKISRREFLKKLGLVGVGTIIGYSGHEIFKSPAKKEIRFYKSGEKIRNPITSIQINKWRLLFEKSGLENYNNRFLNRDVRFVLINPKVKQSPELYNCGGFFVDFTEDYWKMTALPPGENEAVYLHFIEIERAEKGQEKVINQEIYPIILNFYTHKPTEEYDKIRVYSEIDLGENLLKELHQLSKLFDEFCFPPNIYVFESEEETIRGGINSYDENRIELPSNIFTHPKFSNEGVIKLFHELNHSIMMHIIFNQRDQSINRNLYDAYEQLVTKAGWKIPIPTFSLLGPSEEIENNPYFSIFDESSYVRKKGVEGKFITGYGHPYSDHNELFASAMTVFRYFPEEFTERYKHLTPHHQQTIRLVIKTIFSSLESINPNATKTLLPKQELIKKVINQF